MYLSLYQVQNFMALLSTSQITEMTFTDLFNLIWDPLFEVKSEYTSFRTHYAAVHVR